MYYFFLIASMASVSFLKAMEPADGQMVVSSLKESLDDSVWFACHAYNNRQYNLALEYFKKGDPESLNLFQKIEEIKDSGKKEDALRCYCHGLYATRMCDQLKDESEKDKEEMDFLKSSVLKAFENILQEKQETPIAKAIVTKVLQRLKQEDCKWLSCVAACAAYKYNQPNLAVTFFKGAVANNNSSKLLKNIEDIQDASKKENALRGYWHCLFGITMCEKFKDQRAAEYEPVIAQAFRSVLEIKVDTPEAQELVRTALEKLTSFSSTHCCLYTGWEKMGYHLRIGKIDRAIKEMDACILWTDRKGFTYSLDEMKYIIDSPTYSQIIQFDDQKISDLSQKALFLQMFSQLMFINHCLKNDLSSASLQLALQKARSAANILSVLCSDTDHKTPPYFFPLQLSMRWWESILNMKQKFYKLQEDISKEEARHKKVQKIKTYINEFYGMDISRIIPLIEVFEIHAISDDELDKTNNTVRRIFALKKFMDKKSSLQDRKNAIRTLDSLAEKDMYAKNMIGILCTNPNYTFKLAPEEASYKERGIAALAGAYLHANSLEPKAKTVKETENVNLYFYNMDSVLKHYLPLQGNCYVHAELAAMHARFCFWDKMREHAEDMFDTCYLSDLTGEFLTTSLNNIFSGIEIQNDMVVRAKIKNFMSDMEQRSSAFEIPSIKELVSYQELMNRINDSQKA